MTTFKQIFFIITISGSIFSLRETAYAQQEPAQEKKRENVFLHPRKFYKKYFPHLKIKSDPPDSAYIRVYPDYLSVNAYMLSPEIKTDIRPGRSETNGALKLRTNIGDILGFTANYRFVGAGFAFLLSSGSPSYDGYAKSRYRTATIKYNSGAYSMQFRYLRFKGLTDLERIPAMSRSVLYLKRPDIVNKEFRFEGLYNPRWENTPTPHHLRLLNVRLKAAQVF